jgi:hypothetical protein
MSGGASTSAMRQFGGFTLPDVWWLRSGSEDPRLNGEPLARHLDEVFVKIKRQTALSLASRGSRRRGSRKPLLPSAVRSAALKFYSAIALMANLR